jgi:hypothetical protein
MDLQTLINTVLPLICVAIGWFCKWLLVSKSQIDESGVDWNVVCSGIMTIDKDNSTAIINKE